MTQPDWDMTVDAVIIGTGGGALCAALALHEAGLKPLVLEKADKLGGSTAMSGGMVWLPNHPLQKSAGVQDSFEQALTYVNALTGDVGPSTSPERKRAYIETASVVFAFLGRHGIKLRRAAGWPDYHDELPGGCAAGRSMNADIFDARRLGDWEGLLRRGPLPLAIAGTELRNLPLVKRTMAGKLAAMRYGLRASMARLTGAKLVGMGAALQGRLLEVIRKHGIRVELDSPVRELIIENAVALGVVAVLGGRQVAIRATGGVLIAAGGFARSETLRQKFLPQPTSADWSNANPGDTGDMLEAALAAGAATATMNEAVWNLGSMPPGNARPALHTAGDLAKPHLIVVNQAGRRIVDEAGSYMATGQGVYAAGAVPGWVIIESRHRNQYFWAGSRPGVVPEAWRTSGYMKSAGTLEALAALCGIDPEGLTATVERFNEFARLGQDPDFHRGERAYDRWWGDSTNKPNPSLGTIEQPPFYAVKVFPGDVGTYGGIVTDENALVRRQDGSPITGLYACGNAAASVFGRGYPGAGASIGGSLVFGYRAAQDIAKRFKRKNSL